MTTSNTFLINYSDAELRTLVEEFLIQQKTEFSLKSVCSYVLYWAVEDGKVAVTNVLQPSDQDRVKLVLASIVRDGRICLTESDGTTYVKQ